MKFNFSSRYKFSSNGMSESELEFFSTFEHKLLPDTVSESEYYGAGEIIRKYCFYPEFFPIRSRNFHGPDQWDKISEYFVNAKEKYFGLYSKRLLCDFRSRTRNKVSFVIQSPAWIYYKNNKEKFNNLKSGSIFFLSHSTFWTHLQTDSDKVIQFINSFPPEMQPVSICMHFVDIQKNYHLPFLEKNIPVYTAGHWRNKYFIHNFFEIVKHFKFAFGNKFGSQFLYCTMIGIKSILYDDIETKKIEEQDPNNLNAIEQGYTFNQLKKVTAVFSDKTNVITLEQKQLVEEELGIKDGISILHLSFLLYISYFHWFFTSFFKTAKRFAFNNGKKAKNAAIKIMRTLLESSNKFDG